MEVFSELLNGFANAMHPQILLYCFIGVFLGTFIGVLPGLGPTAGMAVLIPLTTGLDPMVAIIMLAGIYYGSMYGGSTAAILINTPGEAAAVVTGIDGFKMSQKGRPGPALGMSAIASFIGGTLSVVGLMLLAPPLAQFALRFGAPEYFALMVLGLTVVIGLSGKSLTKGLISAALGILFATIGLDPELGDARFTFGTVQLMGGIDFISVVVGLFAIAEVLQGAENKVKTIVKSKVKDILPTLKESRESAGPIFRGSIIGFLIGLIPGGSSTVAAFLSYDVEKKFSKNREKLGTGHITGVAAPEAANNSATSGGMVPLLTLGIPASPPLAVLLGALMVHGLSPGPMLFENEAPFVWGLIASMYIGNILLLVLNLPLIKLWVKLTTVPYPVLGPMIMIFCVVGTFGVRNSMFDVWMALMFGVIGYLMKKVNISAVPMVLAVILGPMFERYLRQALSMSQGDPSIFFTRPISLTLILIAAASLILSLYNYRKQQNEVKKL